MVTHAGQMGPPQSAPVSAPFCNPSLHVVPGVVVVFATAAAAVVVVVVGMAVVIARPVHSHGNVHLSGCVHWQTTSHSRSSHPVLSGHGDMPSQSSPAGRSNDSLVRLGCC